MSAEGNINRQTGAKFLEMRIFSLAVAQAHGYTYSMLLPRKPKSKKKKKTKIGRHATNVLLQKINCLQPVRRLRYTSIWRNVPGTLEDPLAIMIVTGTDM